ncbi:MAG: hypothetical protein NC432_13530 [Roseburia sp.]|nr:hypothetical protein [Roseburia sp.]MCM1098778.1 hypothetical protein [Ruminococcus flavefaciens]MCM1235989.1 hypothetical protein [Ruminococcus flavefaciens]
MESRNMDMKAIFNELSDTNKDIVILIAKSVKVAQEVTEQTREPTSTRCVQGGDG